MNKGAGSSLWLKVRRREGTAALCTCSPCSLMKINLLPWTSVSQYTNTHAGTHANKHTHKGKRRQKVTHSCSHVAWFNYPVQWIYLAAQRVFSFTALWCWRRRRRERRMRWMWGWRGFLVRLTLLTTPAQTEGIGSGGWLQEADVRQIQIYRDDNVNNQNNHKGNGGYWVLCQDVKMNKWINI